MSDLAKAELTATKHELIVCVPWELLADCPPLDLEAVLSARTRTSAVPYGNSRRTRIRQYRQLAGWLAYRLIAGHWPEDYYGNEED